MSSNNAEVIRKIEDLSRNIRKKYQILKRGKLDRDSTLGELFSPITKPLHELVDQKNTNPIKLPLEDESIEKEEEEESSNEYHSDQGAIINKDLDADDTLNSVEDFMDRSVVLSPTHYPLTRTYMEGYFNDPKMKTYDTTYGLNFDEVSDCWVLGQTKVHFSKTNNSFTIADKTYPGRKGIYELLFKKDPIAYTRGDLKTYFEILNVTNVHRRNYKPRGIIKASNSLKYRKVIKPLLESYKEVSGRGHKISNRKAIEYVYWDNLNELVDRLKLLISSREVGNNGHDNEIISIIEELKECGIIN